MRLLESGDDSTISSRKTVATLLAANDYLTSGFQVMVLTTLDFSSPSSLFILKSMFYSHSESDANYEDWFTLASWTSTLPKTIFHPTCLCHSNATFSVVIDRV